MPYFTFAIYADYREDWAIEAENIEEARLKLGTDPDGAWLNEARCLDAEPVESRNAFVTGEDDISPAVEEITPASPWAWRAVHRDWIERSLHQNIAAIAAELHTHWLFGGFYDGFGKRLNGFTGIYDLCIRMAETLTEWEIQHGLDQAYENQNVMWIEVVEEFVHQTLVKAINSAQVPDFKETIEKLPLLRRRRR